MLLFTKICKQNIQKNIEASFQRVLYVNKYADYECEFVY